MRDSAQSAVSSPSQSMVGGRRPFRPLPPRPTAITDLIHDFTKSTPEPLVMEPYVTPSDLKSTYAQLCQLSRDSSSSDEESDTSSCRSGDTATSSFKLSTPISRSPRSSSPIFMFDTLITPVPQRRFSSASSCSSDGEGDAGQYIAMHPNGSSNSFIPNTADTDLSFGCKGSTDDAFTLSQDSIYNSPMSVTSTLHSTPELKTSPLKLVRDSVFYAFTDELYRSATAVPVPTRPRFHRRSSSAGQISPIVGGMAMDIQCFRELDSELLFSPKDAFEDLCWSEIPRGSPSKHRSPSGRRSAEDHRSWASSWLVQDDQSSRTQPFIHPFASPGCTPTTSLLWPNRKQAKIPPTPPPTAVKKIKRVPPPPF